MVISQITLSKLLQGRRCKKCANKRKSHGYEYIKMKFKESGCHLLEKEYKNSNTKMKYKCVCGNVSKIKWSTFQQDGRCMKCAVERRSRKYEYIKVKFEEAGCKILEKEYKNNTIPMNFICKCGRKSKTSWRVFNSGSRCMECGLEKKRNPNREQAELNKKKFKNDMALYYELHSKQQIKVNLIEHPKCWVIHHNN